MKVYLLSRPSFDWKRFSAFLSDEGIPPEAGYTVEPAEDGSTMCEVAGRLCYMSYGKGRKTNGEFLQNIISSGHHSVLEHANWTFLITGVSRSLTHELVRHRHLSYSQLSQRYVDESNAEMILPEVIAKDEMLRDIFAHSVVSAQQGYKALVKHLEESFALIEHPTLRRKAARQAARAVLPNATETKICVTGNARAWREVIQKRNSKYADPEIRALAAEIERQLTAEAPNLFRDLEELHDA